jgi:hypothetical protein
MAVKEVELEGVKYKLASIRVGQMRSLGEARKKNGAGSFVEDNIQTVAYCLSNGGNTGCTVAFVEDLPWPVYKTLLELCSELSGFDLKEKTLGEAQPMPPLTGDGSTDGLPQPSTTSLGT